MMLKFVIAASVVHLPLVLGTPRGSCVSKTCKNNPAFPIIKSLQASDFCSGLLGYNGGTVTETVTATATAGATVAVTATVTVSYTETKSTTVSQQVVAVESVPGPVVTVTTRPTETVSVTVTSSYFQTVVQTESVVEYQKNMRRNNDKREIQQDAVAERDRQLKALGQLQKRATSGATTPEPLQTYPASVLSQACKCYVTAPVPTTAQNTVTVTNTLVQTNTNTQTASEAVETVYVSITGTYTTTATTTLPGVTAIQTLPETQTVTAINSVTQTTTVTTTAIVKSGVFTRQLSGRNCVYNRYTHYDLVQEAYTTNDRLFQVCAARCASYTDCRSFFAYQDNDYPYQWCIIDSLPFTPQFLQCSIPFSGANLDYNAP